MKEWAQENHRAGGNGAEGGLSAATHTLVLPRTRTLALQREKGSKTKEGKTGSGRGAMTPRTAGTRIATPTPEMGGRATRRGKIMEHEEEEEG